MRETRLYGLFVDGIRQHPNLAFRKSQAVRVFQSALLNACFAGKKAELKPVKQRDPDLTNIERKY